MLLNKKIKNIIFDFGGVILNIDYQASINAFKELGIKNFEILFSQASQFNIFDKLETGKLNPHDFRDEIRNISGLKLTDEAIDKAWNKMLLDIPIERIELLVKLKSEYNIYLLSNTNAIHYDIYINEIYKAGYKSFDEIFNKAYFSHNVGMRKPHKDIYEYVLNEEKLIPEETLFIDDSLQNLQPAIDLGINTYLMKKDDELVNLFQ
ncbi:MAG: HAD family phosphatase [Bacteroidota bacterium]